MFVKGLKCRECGKVYPRDLVYVCGDCFGPLEIDYDYDAIRRVLTRRAVASRPPTMWRYAELLPLDGPPAVGVRVGCTPLLPAPRLARAWGCREIWIKNDAVQYPTLSFKDRVVAVAISKALEFGMETVGCASTGNLANSVAALAAQAGLEAYVLIPADLEQGKVINSLVYGAHVVGVEGQYDDVNRLCAEIADRFGWGIVNVNLRPFYAEGSKSMGYEIFEDLGWRTPRNVVCPMAGGSLICKLRKAEQECRALGLLESDAPPVKYFGAQAAGCNPIVEMVKQRRDFVRPQRARTIAKSLAIGNPADGYYAYKTMTESGGGADDVTDEEVVAAMRELAESEGIFTETAGGVTVGVARKLVAAGRIPRDESLALCITGNGLKTQEALSGVLRVERVIRPNLGEFERLVGERPADRRLQIAAR
ncbi:MAG: threonine synthase [Planctomycetes bacterium]|nr:threonine synthase [Planctomycetota bacterium]